MSVSDLGEIDARFLRAVAEHVAAERVAAVYLFSPIRQGPTDRGVAIVAESAESAAGDEQPNGATRYTVYTATYRHAVKGRDRGAWAVDVTAQADAPLSAVADVVQGVQRRSAAVAEPMELSGDAFRSIVAVAASAAPTDGASSDSASPDTM
jgi:hypothetical protein